MSGQKKLAEGRNKIFIEDKWEYRMGIISEEIIKQTAIDYDTDKEVVLSAIDSLGLTLDESAIEPLEKMLQQGDKEQKAAMRIGALRKCAFSRTSENNNPAPEARQAASGWLY